MILSLVCAQYRPNMTILPLGKAGPGPQYNSSQRDKRSTHCHTRSRQHPTMVAFAVLVVPSPDLSAGVGSRLYIKQTPKGSPTHTCQSWSHRGFHVVGRPPRLFENKPSLLPSSPRSSAVCRDALTGTDGLLACLPIDRFHVCCHRKSRYPAVDGSTTHADW